MIGTIIKALIESERNYDECEECGGYTYPGANRCGNCIEENLK